MTAPWCHEVFYKFKCWRGEIKPEYTNDFLGVMTRKEYYPYEIPPMIGYPPVNEEYFEWIDLLEAVVGAREKFTMVDLGAGWGRWLCRGAVALRIFNSKLPYRLVGVEAEPRHLEWMREHLIENHVDIAKCNLIEAAVARKDGVCNFLLSEPSWCYGQHIVVPGSGDGGTLGRLAYCAGRLKYLGRVAANHITRLNFKPIVNYAYSFTKHKEKKGEQVKAVSLKTVVDGLGVVDLIDCDIQGAEYDVFAGLPKDSFGVIKRIHIGTHSIATERKLRKLFRGIGWTAVNDFSIGQEVDTRFGKVKFGDGVQTWINPYWEVTE